MCNTKNNKSDKLLGELGPSLYSEINISQQSMPLRARSTNETKVTLTWGSVHTWERDIEKYAG